ncbi:MAG: YlmH/Sll1252 family protein [Oscillibacter sp.]|jgi:RNA-binding protein YlmH|nr:YlmH/Sll1252 family protein [Oscillibacter sp.]
MDKGTLLDRLGSTGDERLLLAHVLDKLDQTERRNIPSCTDFLSPQEQARSRDLLRLAGTEAYTLSGGYEGAERKLLLFVPDWQQTEDAIFPLRCLRASFRAEYQLTHRDILGSLMGLGIVREKVGDLLVGEEGCDIVVADSIADFLLQNWTSAGRAALKVTEVTPDCLHMPVERCEDYRDTVSSLRLDAVASTGFRMSRGKAAALIEGGKVQVNWRDCVKPDHLLSAGDTVTARGLGKFVLAEVGGVTKKGRTSIVVRRWL